MWYLALLPVLMVVFLVFPPTRGMVVWIITAFVGPVLVRTKHLYTDGFRPTPIPDSGATSPIPAMKLADLAAIGFTRRGAWRFEKADGLSTTYCEVFASDELSMLAAIYQIKTFGTTHRISTTMMRVTQDRPISVSDNPMPALREVMKRTEDRGECPSLSRPAWLFEVLTARVAAAGELAPQPLPASTDEWTERLSKEHARMVRVMREVGVLARANRKGQSRITVPWCFRLTFAYLWPLKQKLREAALVGEKQLLHELGLERLLDEASRAPDAPARQLGADPAMGITIPDDRGTLVRIAKPTALRDDDRRLDPRFRAIVLQSQSARQGQFRRISAWLTVGWVVAIIAARAFLGVPVYVIFVVGLVGMIVFGAIMNAGRGQAAEKAAADRLIRRGLCPSCLYGLKGLQADTDGCLVCPECGGAWKRERVQEFADFSSARDDDPRLGVQLDRTAAALGSRSAAFSQPLHGKDSRNQPCALVSPHLRNEIAALAGIGGSEMSSRLIDARTRMRRHGRVLRWITAAVVLLLFVGVPLLVIVRVVTASGGGVGWPIVPLLFGALMGCLFTYGVARGNFGYRPKSMIREMLSVNLCPSCADDLRMLVPKADGCVECACGAAWRVAPPIASAVLPAVSNPPTIPPDALPLQSPASSSSYTTLSD